jgi:hypothetical protein
METMLSCKIDIRNIWNIWSCKASNIRIVREIREKRSRNVDGNVEDVKSTIGYSRVLYFLSSAISGRIFIHT